MAHWNILLKCINLHWFKTCILQSQKKDVWSSTAPLKAPSSTSSVSLSSASVLCLHAFRSRNNWSFVLSYMIYSSAFYIKKLFHNVSFEQANKNTRAEWLEQLFNHRWLQLELTYRVTWGAGFQSKPFLSQHQHFGDVFLDSYRLMLLSFAAWRLFGLLFYSKSVIRRNESGRGYTRCLDRVRTELRTTDTIWENSGVWASIYFRSAGSSSAAASDLKAAAPPCGQVTLCLPK